MIEKQTETILKTTPSCYTKVICPHCDSDHITKSGRNVHDIQRFRCCNPECGTITFMLKYRYKACVAGIKEQAVEMAINGSGIRDTARVLNIDKNTVISTLKKKKIALFR